MSEQENPEPEPRYEIEIDGYLDSKWAAWFGRLTIAHPDGDSTLLSGALPDQTALHSVLIKIRDMNLTLRSVQRIEEQEDE